MVQVIYFITKENEVIFAQGFPHKDKTEAQEAIKATYEDVKAVQEKDSIKDISYTADKLTFTQELEGEADEVHTLLIQERGDK